MADEGTHRGHRQPRQRQERLGEAPQLRRQEAVHHQKRQRERPSEGAQHLGVVARSAVLPNLQARIARQQRRHRVGLDFGVDDPGRRNGGVEPARHRGGATAVDVQTLRIVSRFGDGRHGEERHVAGGNRDGLVHQVAQAAAAFARIAHDNADFVAPALNALGFGAKECIAQLACYLRRRQAGGNAGGRELNVVAPLAELHGVFRLAHGIQGGVGVAHVRRRIEQHFFILVHQEVGRRRRRRVFRGLEGDRLHAQNTLRGPPPEPFEILRGDSAYVRWIEQHLNRRQVIAATAALHSLVGLHGPVAAYQNGHRGHRLSVHCLVRLSRRLGKALGCGGGGLELGANRHGQQRAEPVRADVGAESGVTDHAGRHQPCGNGDREHHGKHGKVGEAHRPGDGSHDLAVDELVEGAAHRRLELLERGTAPRLLPRKVGRQDAECLQERDEQHGCHHQRYYSDELPPRIVQRKQREEGGHGGQRANEYRAADGTHAGYGGCGTFQPRLVLLDDALAHHHRVVHDDADHHEEAEHRQRVDGDAQKVEERQRTDQRNGDAERDPQREAEVEDEQQGDEHQHRADDGVADHGGYAIGGNFRLLLPQHHVGARRRRVAAEEPQDFFGDILRRLPHVRVYANENRGATVDLADEVLVDEAILQHGHIAQPHHGTRSLGHEFDVCEVFRSQPLRDGAEHYFAGVRAQFAAR